MLTVMKAMQFMMSIGSYSLLGIFLNGMNNNIGLDLKHIDCH